MESKFELQIKKLNYYKFGRYFGYPPCCIQEFSESLILFKDRPYEVQLASKHGFLPCLNHSIQILNKEIEIEDLIKNRICPLPFPFQPEFKANTR